MTVRAAVSTYLPSFILTKLDSGSSTRVHWVLGVTVSRFASGFPVANDRRNTIDNLDYYPAVIETVRWIVVDGAVGVHPFDVDNVVLSDSLKNLVAFELHILDDTTR